MFEFSKIDKELNIYRQNDVIVFGASSSGLAVKHILDKYNIKIAAFTDNDVNKVGKNFEGINIISFNDCIEYFCKHVNTIIQIASVHEIEIATQLKSKGINQLIFYSDFKMRFNQMSILECCRKEPALKNFFEDLDWRERCIYNSNLIKDYFLNDYDDAKNIRLMLSAPKVGNATIFNSLKRKNKRIISLWHSYEYIDDAVRDLFRTYPVKLIMGIADPIKQNLSMLYQICEKEYYDLDEYWNAGGDVESIFNNYFIKDIEDNECWFAKLKRRIKTDYLVQNFFDQQIYPFFGVDVYQYPFDKEKGYSVYHINDKLDIMIYQLEKLNDIYLDIGTFLGVENLELVIGNDSNERWYKDSYVNVKNNMPISKEYFNECYTSKYIEHFYSKEDINRFRLKWSSNIKG